MLFLIKKLSLTAFLVSCLIPVPAQDHSQLKVTLDNKNYSFDSHLTCRQLIAQTSIPPAATIGFFTDRDAAIPFYFSCVMADVPAGKISKGDYPVMAVLNDMPVVDPATPRGGFIAIKMNDAAVANPPEYTSVPGVKNMITIQEINDGEVKGVFNTTMERVGEPGKKINLSGTFFIKRSK